jgi:hypothetical protein
MSEMIYRCWTKATRREKGNPRLSFNWAVSRRAWFQIFPDRVQCGDWVLPLDELEGAVLYEGRQSWIPVRVLELRTARGTYQFGFNPWVTVERHLPFPFSREKVRLRHSIFSLAVRVALVLYLAYLLWHWLT